jgi:hypothetical protein
MRSVVLALFVQLIVACSSGDKVKCPMQIPIGARGGCSYPETDVGHRYEYVCSYRLPCQEKTTCTCVPDAAKWLCNVDCSSGQEACELNPNGYICAGCASYSSPGECISAASTPYQ